MKFPSEIVEALGAPPTDEQWKAISMPLQPYVLVAGAGSGKTSVMAARVVYLALAATGRLDAEGVMPGNVVCLTFTNKATENLVLRVRKALRTLDLPEGEEPEIMNYHGFAARLIDSHGLRVGVEPGQRILTGAQQRELCARVLDQMTFKHVKAGWQPTLIENILGLAEQMANHRVTPDQVVAFVQKRLVELNKGPRWPVIAANQRLELTEAVRRFRELKAERGLIDFGDQITLALRIAEENPDVVAEYRERFGAALLDEYQDTNVAQAHLLRAVFGDGFPVTAVGDPDQNIYAWRGASLFNLMEFPRQFPQADGSESPQLPLNMNFRSGARILHAADAIIGQVPDDQRPAGKVLVPWPKNGEGEVRLARFTDEWAEAAWIADSILERHSDEVAWSSFAVLCRTSRLFGSLQAMLAQRGMPVEFVDVSGLLRTPEVVEVLAYARAAADPFASVDLGRVLMGPRWRVGFRDVHSVAGWAKGRNLAIRGDEDGEDVDSVFLFAEALEHLDEVEGLSEEGRVRLEAFLDELRALRLEAQKPVPEFLAEVVRRIGLLEELDSHTDRAMAQASRRNLSSFLDQVHSFTPVEGDLTLRAFLDYVAAALEQDKDEWSPAQPSEDDSVKVMTIHKAKGLEFDHVFLPGLADQLLPNTRIQQNPAKKGGSLDFEMRGDAAILPRFAGVMTKFEEALRDLELIEERRTCYVGLTRARQHLSVSGAWWYGETLEHKKASAFFEELADWGEDSGEADVVRGEDPGEDNPMAGQRQGLVRAWPGEARRPSESDDLFADGWRRAALEASADGGVQESLVSSLSAAERKEFSALAESRQQQAADLLARESDVSGGAEALPLPTSVSVSGLITYEQCAKRFFWTSVRPLPQFGGPAARIGTAVHQWIEQQAAGQASLIEIDEMPDLAAEELTGEPGKVERLRENFLSSRFAGTVPLFAERPFMLSVGGFAINGRIDAIYGEPDGPWEVVDYKTGKQPPGDDPTAKLQLDLYALACMEIWGKSPEDLKLTYLYLADPAEVSQPVETAEAIRTRVEASLARIAARDFTPEPGPRCRWCDFRSFCDPGKAWLAAGQPST